MARIRKVEIPATLVQPGSPLLSRPTSHSIMNRLTVLPALLSAAALFACARVEIPLAVTIRSPSDGATLMVGHPFSVIADSDLDQPPDQPTLFEVELLDRASGYRTTWQVSALFGTEPHILDEGFLVPSDAPAGDDYTLTVSVMAGGSAIDDQSYVFSDTIRVRVSVAP